MPLLPGNPWHQQLARCSGPGGHHPTGLALLSAPFLHLISSSCCFLGTFYLCKHLSFFPSARAKFSFSYREGAKSPETDPKLFALAAPEGLDGWGWEGGRMNLLAELGSFLIDQTWNCDLPFLLFFFYRIQQ